LGEIQTCYFVILSPAFYHTTASASTLCIEKCTNFETV